MFDIYNPMILTPENDPMKGLSVNERIKICFLQLVGILGTVVIGLLAIGIISLFTSCSSPKIIEQHHHHYEQADTLAIQARIDQSLNSWHEQIDSSWRQSWQEYSASWFSHDDQKETITETITTYIDSLGREVRQEQRVTDRSLSKMQQQTEQRLTREFELRLSVVVDSVNGIWQQRFDALQAHSEKNDSISVQSGFPATEKTPWYKRWWQTIKDYLLIAAIIAALIMTRNLWLPLVFKLFRKK